MYVARGSIGSLTLQTLQHQHLIFGVHLEINVLRVAANIVRPVICS